VTQRVSGVSYLDFERIKKHKGHIYYWDMVDFLKPQQEFLSVRTYNQGDCKLFQYKVLSISPHKEPMGGGTGEPFTPPVKWMSPPSESISEIHLKQVCSR
jgi:hypothetical protein